MPIIAARCLPFIRTFVRFVAGVAEITRAKFTMLNGVGAVIRVVGIVTLGCLFGNIPFVKTDLDRIIRAMIFVPGLLVSFGLGRRRGRPLPRAGLIRRAPGRTPRFDRHLFWNILLQGQCLSSKSLCLQVLMHASSVGALSNQSAERHLPNPLLTMGMH